MSYMVYAKTVDGEVHTIGRYDSKEEAEEEYRRAWQAMHLGRLICADTSSCRKTLNARYLIEVGMDDTPLATAEVLELMDRMENCMGRSE